MFKLFVVLFAGLFSNDVISYDPLLTYSFRIQKFFFHYNMSGQLIVDHHRDQTYINGNFTIKTNYLIDSSVVVIYRCNSEGFDCEYWQTWKFMNYCKTLNEKNQLWTKFVDSIQPPFHCPLNKGNYQIVNATFDPGLLLIIYPELTNYQWRNSNKFFSGDVYVGSLSAHWQLFGYRKRTKSILNAKN